MRRIHYFNIFAIGLPLLLALVGFISEDFFFYALISTMLTGFIQVVLGIYLFFDDPKDHKIKIYLGCVVTYFSLWLLIGNSALNSGYLNYILILTPITLAIYLTIIILKKVKS
ncbi:MAG: hypothetical protein ABI263_04080 [Gelidibacter sp.]